VTTLPEGARLENGRGGLQRLVLRAAEAEAHVYTHGANVTHFQPKAERPVLWLSEQSAFEGGTPGKPIRGGVPICFPWFGPKPEAPVHGVARLLEWTVAGVEAVDGEMRASLTLASSDFTRVHFAFPFELQLAVTVGRSLALGLRVRNTGAEAFRFEEALHSYFAVGQIHRVSLTGLESTTYVDKTDGGARKTLGTEPLTFRGETDRVFPGVEGPITIHDPEWQRRIVVRRTGSRTAVVWNPWIAKAKAMPDFGDDEWTGMVCVEAANALGDALTLPPGAEHTITTTVTVERG
jgi:glucose-6-phosphate 1-epimerase